MSAQGKALDIAGVAVSRGNVHRDNMPIGDPLNAITEYQGAQALALLDIAESLRQIRTTGIPKKILTEEELPF